MPGGAVLAPKKPRPASKKEAGRRNKNMVRITDDDHAMLAELAERHGRKLAAENHQALIDYFRKHGLMPPASPGAGEN